MSTTHAGKASSPTFCPECNVIRHLARRETFKHHDVAPPDADATSLIAEVLVGGGCLAASMNWKFMDGGTFTVLQELTASDRRIIYGTRHVSHMTCEGRRGH